MNRAPRDLTWPILVAFWLACVGWLTWIWLDPVPPALSHLVNVNQEQRR